MNKKIFVIHGHDSEALEDLHAFLESQKTTPIIIQTKTSMGSSTIIEKFEKYAKDAVFAIALLTPDDKQAEELEGNSKFRARQNVILEMGWFMGKLGRERIILLHKGSVELPSDIIGISYMKFENTISEIHEKIIFELREQGLIVDK